MKAIKISTIRGNKPLLTVGETPDGIRVLDGDPEMIDRLGLSKYKDLAGILRGIHRSSELSATELEIPDQAEGEAQKPAEEVPQVDSAPEVTAVKIKEFEEKLKAPLDAIKKVWDLFKDHAKVRARKAQTEEDLAGAQKANKTPEEPTGIFFISFDGDNIGKKTESAEKKDDEKTVTETSNAIQRGGQSAKDWALQHNGEVIEQGGDEGLIKVPSEALKHLEDFRTSYKQVVKATLTIGIGQSITEATKARELGKLRGKDCVVYYNDSTEQELKLRLDQNPDQKAPEQEEWSMKHFDEQSSPVAVEQMIKELIEEGITNRDELTSVLEDHGLDDFPGIEQMIDAALGDQNPPEQEGVKESESV